MASPAWSTTTPRLVRSPEQNTGPNVFYLGADRAVLDPLAAPVEDTYIWAKPDAQRLETAEDLPGDPATNARTTLNTAHPRPWGWKVTTYLWTKGVGAGALALACLAHLLGVELGAVGDYVAPLLGLFGAATTGALLVWDLKRPERFLYIFLKSNWTSWLVLGSYVLTIFSGGAVLWLLAVLLDLGWLMTPLAWLGLPASAMMAGYTAFLFGQAEGRDLWQSRLLFWHLLVQAVMVGSGALAVAGLFADLSDCAWTLLAASFVTGAVLHLVLLGLSSTSAEHETAAGRRGRADRQLGPLRTHVLARRGAPVALAVVLGATAWAGAPVVCWRWPDCSSSRRCWPTRAFSSVPARTSPCRDPPRRTPPSLHPASKGPVMTLESEREITPLVLPGERTHERLRNFPPVSDWDHHVEYDAKAHPRKVPHEYMLVPTTCFNCESACGLLAYVDKSDMSIKKLEGNPAHPGSRGRNCAKGPATINQINDPERILHPLRRAGKRGGGDWERVSWDDALDDIAAKIRAAIVEDRKDEVALPRRATR